MVIAFLKWLNENVEKYMVALLFIAFSGIMMLNVVTRYVFGNAISWASEVVLLMFVWFVWFAISYAFKEKAHIKVTLLTSMLSAKGQRILDVVADLLVVVFLLVLMKACVNLIGHFSVQEKSSLILRYPMMLFYLSAPVGGGLSVFRILQNAYDDLVG